MDLDGDDTSAEVCASFIANRADYGSYHRLVDSDSIIDMLPFEYEAWQDSETNNWAVGISAAVQAGRWNQIPGDRRDRIYRNMAAAAAEFVRHMANKGITVPLLRISGVEARARVPGFCAHGDSGVSRSDPGVQFDWALFFAYTQAALNGSLSYASESIQEDDMPITDQDAAKIASAVVSYNVNQEGGIPGQINLGAALAWYNANNRAIIDGINGQIIATGSELSAALKNTAPSAVAEQINAAGIAREVYAEIGKLFQEGAK